VVGRLRTRTRAAGTRRFTVRALSPGAYTVRIVARAGKSRSVVRLAMRRL